MTKFTKIFLIGIPILIVVFIGTLYFSLNSIIKHGIETIGPRATGTEVKLQKANISLFTGKGYLKGLFIGNPEGFQTNSAFTLNEVKLALNVKSVFSDKIVIDEILIDSPDITYEKSSKSDNIKNILKNIEKFSGESGSPDEKNVTEETKKDEKKLQINNFIVRNGKVNMSISGIKGKNISLSLPDIHMKDIGKEDEGASLSKVLEEVFIEVNKKTSIAVAGSVKSIGGGIDKTVGKSADTLKGLFGK